MRRILIVLVVLATVLLTGSAQGGPVLGTGIKLGPEYAAPGHERVEEVWALQGEDPLIAFQYTAYGGQQFWIGILPNGSSIYGEQTDAEYFAGLIHAPGTYLRTPTIFLSDMWDGTPRIIDARTWQILPETVTSVIMGDTVIWYLPKTVVVRNTPLSLVGGFQIDGITQQMNAEFPNYDSVVPLIGSWDAQASAVPEPSALVLALIGILSSLAFRCPRRAP